MTLELDLQEAGKDTLKKRWTCTVTSVVEEPRREGGQRRAMSPENKLREAIKYIVSAVMASNAEEVIHQHGSSSID